MASRCRQGRAACTWRACFSGSVLAASPSFERQKDASRQKNGFAVSSFLDYSRPWCCLCPLQAAERRGSTNTKQKPRSWQPFPDLLSGRPTLSAPSNRRFSFAFLETLLSEPLWQRPPEELPSAADAWKFAGRAKNRICALATLFSLAARRVSATEAYSKSIHGANVGETPDFLASGGAIDFLIAEDRLQFEVNIGRPATHTSEPVRTCWRSRGTSSPGRRQRKASMTSGRIFEHSSCHRPRTGASRNRFKSSFCEWEWKGLEIRS